MTSSLFNWVTWPFRAIKNIMVAVYDVVADKTIKILQQITWPFMTLANKVVSSEYTFLKPNSDNPMIAIESVLELIWIPLKPALQAGWWLCEFMATVKSYVKVTDKSIEDTLTLSC